MRKFNQFPIKATFYPKKIKEEVELYIVKYFVKVPKQHSQQEYAVKIQENIGELELLKEENSVMRTISYN